MGIAYNPEQDEVMLNIQQQIQKLHADAMDYQLSLLPTINVKVVGYEDGIKEALAELQGELRLDHFYHASQSKESALELLLDGYDPKKAREVGSKVKRIFFVIDCTDKVDSEPPETPPEPQTDQVA